MSQHLFVGSTNPVKINAVTTAASETWPDVQVRGYEVESKVSAQPKSDKETRTGALNRAHAALIKGSMELGDEPRTPSDDDIALGIGMEGGIFEEEGEMWSTVWCAVVDHEGNEFTANGARFKVPDSVAARIREGLEMSDAVVRLTGIENVKQKHGMLGVITNNFIDRTEEYSGIAKLALGLWYGKDWERMHDPVKV